MSDLKKSGPWDHDLILPVRIVLRELAAWKEKEQPAEQKADLLKAFIRAMLIKNGVEEFWDHLHTMLLDEKSQVLVMLDGLDEVPENLRKPIVHVIEKFSERYPKNRYLVTCRIYAYAGQNYQLSDFKQTVLAPFDDDQINSFTDAWYGRLAEKKRFSDIEASERSERLKRALTRRDHKELAQRPLLMTVMAMLHTSFGRLPEDRIFPVKQITVMTLSVLQVRQALSRRTIVLIKPQ